MWFDGRLVKGNFLEDQVKVSRLGSSVGAQVG